MAAGRDGGVRIMQKVRPMLTTSKDDSKRRVLGLYKAWSRQIPFIVDVHYLPKSVPECRAKLREKFEENKGVSDVRVVDVLIMKGRMELQETVNKWKQPCHIMNFFNESRKPKSTAFVTKFLTGKD